MTFLWLKALHIIAVIAWMAGLLYLPRLFAYHAACADAPGRERFQQMESRLYRRIMGPAMGAAILLGFAAMGAGRLGGGWLWTKIALVGVLLAFHIWCGRCVRKFARDETPHSEKFFRVANEAPAILMIAIVILVVLKPF